MRAVCSSGDAKVSCASATILGMESAMKFHQIFSEKRVTLMSPGCLQFYLLHVMLANSTKSARLPNATNSDTTIAYLYYEAGRLYSSQKEK